MNVKTVSYLIVSILVSLTLGCDLSPGEEDPGPTELKKQTLTPGVAAIAIHMQPRSVRIFSAPVVMRLMRQ